MRSKVWNMEYSQLFMALSIILTILTTFMLGYPIMLQIISPFLLIVVFLICLYTLISIRKMRTSKNYYKFMNIWSAGVFYFILLIEIWFRTWVRSNSVTSILTGISFLSVIYYWSRYVHLRYIDHWNRISIWKLFC